METKTNDEPDIFCMGKGKCNSSSTTLEHPCVQSKGRGIRLSSIVSIVVRDGVQLPSRLRVGLDIPVRQVTKLEENRERAWVCVQSSGSIIVLDVKIKGIQH